ncbi:sigma-70 family RNA polymerase sigma factor [Pseudoflavonifractor sp. HCP28S3_F10]|uniref:sigma-70 family RNA polymerase sigma factor n=1 Tax=Pseudoflavonifractor sp. HCP28S3_F10 TaxID=3438947 RepID=UPI003F89362E
MSNEELVERTQAGERDKLPALWEQVEKFVAMQARKCARRLDGFGGVDEEDLYQSGFLALVDAAERFDSSAGSSFIGFLALRLRSYFAEAAGYRGSRRDMLDYASGLDDPIPGTDDLTAADSIEDHAAQAPFEDVGELEWREQLHEALERALMLIPAEQAATLRRRFYNGKTLAKICEEDGVYPETVRQRENKGLRSIRRSSMGRELAQFIELKTPYYSGVGLGAFRRGGSQPERLSILRERLAERCIDRDWEE